MAFVKIDKKDENGFEKAIRLFKKQCVKEGIIEEIKQRKYYIPKSVLKQKRNKIAIGKKLKALKKNQKMY